MSEFIEMKTAELHGSALDWAVAKATQAEELKVTGSGRVSCIYELAPREGCWTNDYCPSTEWSEGGLLIEKLAIGLQSYSTEIGGPPEYWVARSWEEGTPMLDGPTPLVAACRTIAAHKLGMTVSVPAALLEEHP